MPDHEVPEKVYKVKTSKFLNGVSIGRPSTRIRCKMSSPIYSNGPRNKSKLEGDS